ncbi:MAG: hypothetical protein CM1200mP33_0920 [Chloroflexota bacterium]|nr:MAG: hypothetical protein CM1200mP33_0920 [Chloroflexota bacterium]
MDIDYVIMGYGNGAIMAVPGQDQRDWDFAKKFDLNIVRTVQVLMILMVKPTLKGGLQLIAGFFDGLYIDDAKEKILKIWVEAEKKGERAIQYKLRDWLFSRQRYWGEPIPIKHKDGKQLL